MSAIHWQIAANLAAAWAAGGVIGFERSYHGRAAGFRTHALVALASAAVMTIALVPSFFPGAIGGAAQRLDPTRLAQGVMTGVGFLGAGVIFKEGVNVQGLTTAASIWATAAMGLLFGGGLFAAGLMAATALFLSLTVLRWIEDRLPAPVYAWSAFRFEASRAPSEADFRASCNALGVSLAELSYGRSRDGDLMEFNGNLRADSHAAFQAFAARLSVMPGLVEFRLSRITK